MAVYFLRLADAQLIKIGYSLNVSSRVKALATASPIPLELIGTISDGSRFLELQLHRYFADQRQHGEWFRESPMLLGIARGERGEIIEALLADAPADRPLTDFPASDPEAVDVALELIEAAGGLATPADIAREWGVTHQAIEKRIRAGMFPDPAVRAGRMRLYFRAQIAHLKRG